MNRIHTQRAHCRREMAGAMQVEMILSGNPSFHVNVVDFTPEGMGVSIDRCPTDIGNRVEIAVENEGRRQVVRGWLRHYTKGRAGIEFDDPVPEVMELIGSKIFTDAASLIDLAVRHAAKNGMDVDVLADEVQVSRSMMNALACGETDITRLTPESLRRLAKIAGVTTIEAYLAAGLLTPQDVWETTLH